MDFRISVPCRIIICGPTEAGKTTFLVKLLSNQNYCFHEHFDEIIWCSGTEQTEIIKTLEKNSGSKVTYYSKFPEKEIQSGEILDNAKNGCIVLDDLIDEIDKSKTLIKLFTKFSHHNRWSIFLPIQCFFWPGETIKIVQRNATHFILFNSPRDAMSVRIMAKQMFVGNSKVMVSAYEQATETPRGYLLVDLSPSTPQKFRLRSNILPDESYSVFIDKMKINKLDDSYS